MNGPLVIVGCGAGKVDHPARPGELYTGQHYRACLSTALAIVPASWVRILSAKHGLLRLDGELVDPYDLTLGQPGAITAAELAEQAAALGELGRPVVALCGKRYAALIGAVWSEEIGRAHV